MENALQIFDNPEFGKIRVALINGEPYFVGKDVATALAYSNARDALINHVDERDKIVITRKDFEEMASNQDSRQTRPSYSTEDFFGESAIGGTQRLTFINESGLYSLIFSSKLPKAKEFKHWVTADVLPKIRKYGVYATKDAAEYFLQNPEQAAKVFMELANERKEKARLAEENAVLTQQVAELTPKASYYDVVLNCKDLVSVSKIAKDYGMSATEMNKLLHKLGVQYKQSEVWLLYQKYAKLGWSSTKTITYPDNEGFIHSKVHTYWTPKGRLGLYELLKIKGYLPLIELNDR